MQSELLIRSIGLVALLVACSALTIAAVNSCFSMVKEVNTKELSDDIHRSPQYRDSLIGMQKLFIKRSRTFPKKIRFLYILCTIFGLAPIIVWTLAFTLALPMDSNGFLVFPNYPNVQAVFPFMPPFSISFALIYAIFLVFRMLDFKEVATLVTTAAISKAPRP